MKGGARQGAGRKPIWNAKEISERIDKLSDIWWFELEKMMQGKNKREKLFAMSEFNKLQVKAMPQKLAGDENGQAIPIQIISFKQA